MLQTGNDGEGGLRECANRRESVISRTLLSCLCGQVGDERSKDMADLNKHRNHTLVTHAYDLILT